MGLPTYSTASTPTQGSSTTPLATSPRRLQLPQGSSRFSVAVQRRFWGIPRVHTGTVTMLTPTSNAKHPERG